MSEVLDAGAQAGEDTFDADFEAARVADEAAVIEEAPEVKADDAEPKEEPKAEGEKKPPLSPEEIERRWKDQKAATRAERQKRQEAEQARQALEARIAELEKSSGAKSTADDPRPNPQEDPIGYMEWLDRRLDAQQAQEAEQTRLDEQRQAQQQEIQTVVSRVQEFENDFREQHSDYDAAAEHLYQAKMAEYAESGYEGQEAHNMVMAEFLTRSRRALSANKDPAEIVYNLAKKAGYGAVQADAEAEKAAAEAKAKLEKIAAGQKAASPLAGAGGRGGDELDMSDIAHLEGAAFDKAFDKLMEKARRAGHW